MTEDSGKSPPAIPPESDSNTPASTEEDRKEELAQDQSPPTSTEEESGEEPTQVQSPPESPPAPPPDLEAPGEDPPDEGLFGALGGAMTFLEHLDELRKRLLHGAAAVGIAFAICWAFSEQIFRFLAVPIADVVAPGQGIEAGMKELIFVRPTEPFSIWIKVSFVGALFLSAPYLLLQVWLFIAPGLYRKEKSYAIPFLVSSTFLFLLGGAFAYYIILPTALEFLINQFG